MRGGARGSLWCFKPRATSPNPNSAHFVQKSSGTAKKQAASAAFSSADACYGKSGHFWGACRCPLCGAPHAAPVGTADPSHTPRLCRSVLLPLSNGVCGIFLLSPLCCRKCEVREPQAPAPVLQVTQPSPLPRMPPASRRSPWPRLGCCCRGTASSPAQGFTSMRWGPRMCDWVGGGHPHRAPHAPERACGSAGMGVWGSAQGKHAAPVLCREEPVGFSQGRLQASGQPLPCSFH